jgi:pyruvate-ferredoxin/flavodoxin oxidoreductase
VLASGENVNLLVLDTEVYSNTGGQTSKATPIGASAKFSFAGKPIRKKDLGALAMTYGYVYVANVAMGANFAQYLKAVREAESYNGPSLIVAYSTCIAHGLRDMNYSQHIMKDAVEAGAWILYRYDPRLAEQGKNPLQLDSKEPDFSKLRDWMLMQTRFSALQRTFPERAEQLFKKAEEDARWRWNYYKHLASIDWSK